MELKKLHFEKTMKIFFYNVLGVTLPFLLSLISMLVLGKTEKVAAFLDEGDIFLFSAGLLTSAILLFNENRKGIKTTEDKILSFIAIWLLIICSAFYAILYTLFIVDVNLKATIQPCFIRLSSITLFTVAIYTVYRSIFIDSLKVLTLIDVREVTKNEIDNILEQL